MHLNNNNDIDVNDINIDFIDDSNLYNKPRDSVRL